MLTWKKQWFLDFDGGLLFGWFFVGGGGFFRDGFCRFCWVFRIVI